MKQLFQESFLASAGLLALAMLAPTQARAHCDGVDGPVVKAAQEALATGNVNLALAWVQSKDEAEVRQAFSKAQAVRKLNPEALELADRFFFETLVRIHRAGEGASFSGLQPAGRDLGPAIPAAEEALERGSADSLAGMIAGAAGKGVKERFHAVAARRRFDKDDVAAGREFVKAYVEFMHYVEGLHEAVHRGGHEHQSDSQPSDPLAHRH